MKKDLVSIKELSISDIEEIFSLAREIKANKNKFSSTLKGKSVGLIFQKPSNRTRVSFEVGVWELGGHCVYLGPDEISLGQRETTEDVAKTLSRYLSAIVARTFSHQTILDLAKYATIPVINGLCDLAHPCQALSDLFTVKEKLKKLAGINLAYVGDGNNVCHSLIYAACKTGVHIKIATPEGYEPNKEVVSGAKEVAKKTKATIELTNDPFAAVKDADVIYTDVWASMGQEDEAEKRKKDFAGFQVNSQLVAKAKKDYLFMHCLPAHRGEEVSDSVIDGKNSIVFDQAENRLHVQKAILVLLLKKVK
ncbi:MAG: ornithine carbamoyltransferase [Candidatus Omnitrophota bacterium]|nr:ornithine carbamoyltransferase [Candidatus Omnitrophota bacterium]